jgi:phosphopantetheinyl transferase (holo-ACP synthase)
MKVEQSYRKCVNRISREEFSSFFSSCKPGEWFSEREMSRFSYPGCAGSLAGRYLIKKAIGDFINEYDKLAEIEILNDEMGKPVVSLGENIEQVIKDAGIKKIGCSISHSRNYFTGMTILCF